MQEERGKGGGGGVGQSLSLLPVDHYSKRIPRDVIDIDRQTKLRQHGGGGGRCRA